MENQRRGKKVKTEEKKEWWDVEVKGKNMTRRQEVDRPSWFRRLIDLAQSVT